MVALERKILKLLRNPKLDITLENLPNWKLADSTWHWEGEALYLKIRADVDRDGLIPCVIHELVHVAMEGFFEQWRLDHNMEEAMVVGVSEMIWNSMKDKPRIINRWRKAINAKLK